MSRICGSGPRESQTSTAIQNGQMGLQGVEQVHRSCVCEHPRLWDSTLYQSLLYSCSYVEVRVWLGVNRTLHIHLLEPAVPLHEHERMRAIELLIIGSYRSSRNAEEKNHRPESKWWYKCDLIQYTPGHRVTFPQKSTGRLNGRREQRERLAARAPSRVA
jgi:hypothetical protein